MNSADLLAACGRGLYGDTWQSDLARSLGVSRTTLIRWLTGRKELRPDRWVDLLELVEKREERLEVIAFHIRQRATATVQPP